MAKFEKKQQAMQLRRKGMSISQIAGVLSVAKSSVSLWTRDIVLSKSQKEKLRAKMIAAGHAGRLKGAEVNKKKKEQIIEQYQREGKVEVGSLSNRDFLLLGLGLYWGEGSKTDKLAFVNSDPQMIHTMFLWFKEIMKVKDSDFMPRIFINKIHRPREKVVLEFWAKLLHLPVSQFGNITYLNVENKKTYSNHNHYFGILSLRIRKSTNLKYKILGLIHALKECNMENR